MLREDVIIIGQFSRSRDDRVSRYFVLSKTTEDKEPKYKIKDISELHRLGKHNLNEFKLIMKY